MDLGNSLRVGHCWSEPWGISNEWVLSSLAVSGTCMPVWEHHQPRLWSTCRPDPLQNQRRKSTPSWTTSCSCWVLGISARTIHHLVAIWQRKMFQKMCRKWNHNRKRNRKWSLYEQKSSQMFSYIRWSRSANFQRSDPEQSNFCSLEYREK